MNEFIIKRSFIFSEYLVSLKESASDVDFGTKIYILTWTHSMPSMPLSEVFHPH